MVRGLVRFCSMGGSSSNPPCEFGGEAWSVRFSRNFSQSTSRVAFSFALASPHALVHAGVLDVPIREGLGLASFAVTSFRLFVLKHRVVVELLADLFHQLEPGKLQQTDCLLKLGRHDQLLRQA